jgi:hypothetical protein
MKSADVKAAIRKRWSGQEWAVFFEVADGTGGSKRRYADAVAMNLWPSRGLEVHGFEIKVSRSDWLSELKKPEKSAAIQQYCDRWWIITPAGIIKPGELPPTWGQYQVSESGQITQVVAAPALQPMPVDRAFVAALLRRAGAVDQDEVYSIVQKQVQEQADQIRKNANYEVERLTENYKKLREKLDTINKLTGIDLTRFTPEPEVASCINLVLKLGVFRTYGTLQHLLEQSQKFTQEVQTALLGMQPKESDLAGELTDLFKKTGAA